MKEFFEVVSLSEAKEHLAKFDVVGQESVPVTGAVGRVLGKQVVVDADLPPFRRSTMDGYAVQAASTYGSSESAPAMLPVVGSVTMGKSPEFSVGPGQVARIMTGGMLPKGTDSVVMVEHTEAIDERSIELYRSAAPGQNVIEPGEDFAAGQTVLSSGTRLGPSHVGTLAALGREQISVFRRPRVGIISTGDEIVPVAQKPGLGQVRDVNSHTLSALVIQAGAQAELLGLVGDDFDQLLAVSRSALETTDMVLLSGGSSVGNRDFTIDVLSSLPQAEILVHGIAVKPGKPTILARVGAKAFWGLPGHVTSAMVVFRTLVLDYLERISGVAPESPRQLPMPARLSRNVASVHGRAEYLRVQLEQREGRLWAVPVLGKSGLINTMVKADGLIEIPADTEGLDRDSPVWVIPI